MSEAEALKTGLTADIARAETLEAVEALRVGALGKNGVITGLLKTLGTMTPESGRPRAPRSTICASP